MHYIDAHTHLWTPDIDHYALSAGVTKADMKPPSFTPEQFFGHAKPTGVDRAVIIQMSFYGTDNSYMLDCIKRFPESFRGIAVIDHQAAKPETEVLRLAKEKVRGFRIRPTTKPAGDWLSHPGYERMFSAGAKANMAMCPLIDPDALPALSRMCARHPETPVIIDHLCRIGAAGPIRDEDVDALCGMARHERVMVKVSAFYALGAKKPPHHDLIPMIRRVVDAFGVARLMWASDCPYQVDNEKYGDSVGLIQRLEFLSAEEKNQMLRGTAEKFFFA